MEPHSKPLRCLAVDDEPLALDLLVDNIQQVPFLRLIGTASNAFQAMDLLAAEQPDLLFLDIQMPGLTGLGLLRSLRQPPAVILVTAYESHALEGFELDVVDYLVKPVSMERFLRACTKAQIALLRTAHPAPPPVSHLVVPVEYEWRRIPCADILCIEGYSDYVKIHLKGQSKPVLSRSTLKALLNRLPTSMLRVHKSYIVNLDHVQGLRRNTLLLGTKEVPVGEQFRTTTLDALHLTGSARALEGGPA